MNKRFWLYVVVIVICLLLVGLYSTQQLYETYESLASRSIIDRNGQPIQLARNIHDNHALYQASFSDRLMEIIVQKEDQYFWYHPGINPVSISRALFAGVSDSNMTGASTITQQVVKILLKNTSERTLLNKLQETVVALLLELRFSKETILTMYLNLVYLGNETQGFATGSYVYFGKSIDQLTDPELVTLLATISSPTTSHPWTAANQERTTYWLNQLSIPGSVPNTTTQAFSFNKPAAFEVAPLLPDNCTHACQTTVDVTLTETIRSIVTEHTSHTTNQGGTSAAVVVLDAATGEIVAIVGSPDPTSTFDGAQINMATNPRPTGSTLKPFIFAHAFEAGARPYSLINDREYKYPIGTGHPLYPKNFDGTYAGEVTLHHALANSLNTPSVRLLDFTTLESFYSVLENDLELTPINPLSSYAYGIALGGLEMDLLTLTNFFTVFSNKGMLLPLAIQPDTTIAPPFSTHTASKQIFDQASIELVTRILTDRQAGVEQFGIKSTLDVFNATVAVKTGTSRDFHDSWTIGYTPDYIVGVWLGNPENKPLDQLSGAAGAGALWRKVVEHVRTTSYDKNTQFTYNTTELINVYGSTYRTVIGDVPADHRDILLDDTLILLPHDGDSFLFTAGDTIKLTSSTRTTWTINGQPIGTGQNIDWNPPAPGSYNLTASTESASESITIEVVSEATRLQ